MNLKVDNTNMRINTDLQFNRNLSKIFVHELGWYLIVVLKMQFLHLYTTFEWFCAQPQH